MISQDQLLQNLKQPNSDLYLLDVRTPHEFEGGHLPGSVNIPINELEERVNEIPKTKRIVCICAHGVRSGIAAQFLTDQKYQADSLENGLSVWKGTLNK